MPAIGRRGDKLDLVIRQGTTLGPFVICLADAVGVARNLTGNTIRASIRKDYAAVTAYPITAALTEPENGKFSITMTPAETAAIPYLGDPYEEANEYLWDLEMEDASGNVEAIFWGIARVFGETTQ